MKHALLKKEIITLEKEMFNCKKCNELYSLRKSKAHNCPVLGFDFDHYVNARVLSLCEAPGIYKPHKGEIFIEQYKDFHSIYDTRLQDVSKIGKRILSIFDSLKLTWDDIQHFNVVCCSPPNYRTPTYDEAENC